MSNKKTFIISLISAAVILGIGGAVSFVSGGAYIPNEFFTERIAGAGNAKHIAQLVSYSLANLQKIEQLDRAGNTLKALELVGYEHANQHEKQDAAVLLSGHLQQMAKATETIKPLAAKELAVEVVSTGVSMVSHVINYNADLDNLLAALNAKLGHTAYTGPSVQTIVSSINAEAQEINDLNQQFNKLLEQFDSQFVH